MNSVTDARYAPNLTEPKSDIIEPNRDWRRAELEQQMKNLGDEVSTTKRGP